MKSDNISQSDKMLKSKKPKVDSLTDHWLFSPLEVCSLVCKFAGLRLLKIITRGNTMDISCNEQGECYITFYIFGRKRCFKLDPHTLETTTLWGESCDFYPRLPEPEDFIDAAIRTQHEQLKFGNLIPGSPYEVINQMTVVGCHSNRLRYHRMKHPGAKTLWKHTTLTEFQAPISCMTRKDNMYFIGCRDGLVAVYDMQNRKLVDTLSVSNKEILCIKVLVTGNLLVITRSTICIYGVSLDYAFTDWNTVF